MKNQPSKILFAIILFFANLISFAKNSPPPPPANVNRGGIPPPPEDDPAVGINMVIWILFVTAFLYSFYKYNTKTTRQFIR